MTEAHERFMATFGPVVDYYKSHSGPPGDIRLYGIGRVTYDPPIAFIWVAPGVEVPGEIGGVTILAEVFQGEGSDDR